MLLGKFLNSNKDILKTFEVNNKISKSNTSLNHQTIYITERNLHYHWKYNRSTSFTVWFSYQPPREYMHSCATNIYFFLNSSNLLYIFDCIYALWWTYRSTICTLSDDQLKKIQGYGNVPTWKQSIKTWTYLSYIYVDKCRII